MRGRRAAGILALLKHVTNVTGAKKFFGRRDIDLFLRAKELGLPKPKLGRTICPAISGARPRDEGEAMPVIWLANPVAHVLVIDLLTRLSQQCSGSRAMPASRRRPAARSATSPA